MKVCIALFVLLAMAYANPLPVFIEEMPVALVKLVRPVRSPGNYPVMMTLNPRLQKQELPTEEGIPNEVGAPLGPEADVTPIEEPALKKGSEDDDDDDDDDTDAIGAIKPGTGGVYNAFFPMTFARGHSGTLAIANSFSSGRKGVATSHATAHGSKQ